MKFKPLFIIGLNKDLAMGKPFSPYVKLHQIRGGYLIYVLFSL